MKLRRALTTVVTLATTLALTPVVHAETADPATPAISRFKIESWTDSGVVWDQPKRPDGSDPTLAWPSHDGLHQQWEFATRPGSIVNVGNGLCATAIGDKLYGRECNGSAAQDWEFEAPAIPFFVFKNTATGTCVKYAGREQQLILAPCEEFNRDQTWMIVFVSHG